MCVELEEKAREDKQRRRNAHWSKVAGYYRRTWQEATPEAALFKELEASLFIEATAAKSDMRILDICSGTGRNTVALATTGASVWGVDGAAGMVEQARQYAAECNLDNVTFVEGDATLLPFADNTFDAVTGTRFMYMMTWDDKRKTVAEAHRVLKPGGRVVLQFTGAPWGLVHETCCLLTGQKSKYRNRFLWPGQAARLFQGFRIERIVGVKLPRLASVSRLTGTRLALAVNRILRVPGFAYFNSYVYVIATCLK